MDSKNFKKCFGEIACINDFKILGGGWLKETSEIILLLGLQKSQYANYFYLNIKIFIHGLFGENYKKDKELHKQIGNIFLRSPREYEEIFNLDVVIDDNERKLKINFFFEDFLVPFSEKALNIQNLKNMALANEIFLTPYVEEKLGEKLNELNTQNQT